MLGMNVAARTFDPSGQSKPDRVITSGAVGVIRSMNCRTRSPVSSWQAPRPHRGNPHHAQVRGAPLIGVAAPMAVALAQRADRSDASLGHRCGLLASTRPTARHLRYALEEFRAALLRVASRAAADEALARSGTQADEDVQINRRPRRTRRTPYRAGASNTTSNAAVSAALAVAR